MIVDFTAPQFGIIQYNISNLNFPVWICPEEKQTAYIIKEIILPSEIKNYISKLINDNQNSNLDFFPIAVLSYKNALIEKIMSTKIFNLQKENYPNTAKYILNDEAIEKNWKK